VEHTTAGLVPQILVRAAPGTDAPRLTATLAGLADQHSGLEVADWSAAAAAFSETERTGAWVNYLLVGMIVGYAVISLVNTLIVATAERRREFAVQRLIGSTRSQVMRMMIMEASFVTLAGIMLGGVVAVATLAPFNIALTGTPVPHGPLWIHLIVIGSATLLTFTATLVPAWIALRPRPTGVLAASA
jgi:putative ABC transport system permease protein